MIKKIAYTACLLATNILFASPVDYDLSIYGRYNFQTHPEYATYEDISTNRNNFWWQKYYDFSSNSDLCTDTDCSNNTVTHAGLDFGINIHPVGKVFSYGYGKVTTIGDQCIGLAKGYRDFGLVRIRNLTTSGGYFYGSLLHSTNIDVNNLGGNSYIAKKQYIGQKGGMYGCSIDGLARHLHLEISDSAASIRDVVISSNSYPCNNVIDTDLFCGDGEGHNTRDGVIKHGLQAHYEGGSEHYYFNPIEFKDEKEELLPFLGRTIDKPSSSNFNIYGIANKTIYGSLNINSTTINKVGILARNSLLRGNAESAQSTANPKYLVSREDDFTSLNGSNQYNEGDYLFLAYVRQGASTHRYGYPVVFSFVNEGSFIIDNDKEAYTDGTSYAVNLANNSTTNTVPGYFLTSKLVQINANSANDHAEWKLPNNANNSRYNIFAHIPKGATAKVTYKIHTVDNLQIGESVDIEQNNFSEEWVRLGISNYELGANSFVSVSVADAIGHDNNNNKWMAFDAIKFEKVDSTINSVFDGSGSLIAPEQTCSDGCNDDYAKMQPHSNISLSSTVTFQWKKDEKNENKKLICDRIVISAVKKLNGIFQAVSDLDVNIEKRYWTGQSSESYQITLPASISRLEKLTDDKHTYDWDLISITSVSPLTESVYIHASCKNESEQPLPAQLTTKGTGSKIAFSNQYVWGGSGSLISNAGGKSKTGKTKDNIKIASGRKSQSIIQWHTGSTCKKVQIRSQNSKNYTSSSIRYYLKKWDEPNWFNQTGCNGKIPCTLNGESLANNDYYMLLLNTGSDVTGLNQIVAVCQK